MMRKGVLLQLLGLGAGVFLAPVRIDAGDVPGSAAMPAKTLHAPSPPAPADGHGSGLSALVWIDAAGAVENVELLKGDRDWYPEVENTLRGWTFEPVRADGVAIPARIEIGVGFRKDQGVSLSMSPLPNLPGELHDADEPGLVPPTLVHDPDVILPLSGRLSRATPRAVVQYVVEADGSTGRFEVLESPSEQALRAAVDLVSVRRYRPATVHGAAVAVEYIQGIAFVGQGETIAGLDGATAVTDPVYPYDRLVAGEGGMAKVRFGLASSGEVARVEVVEATQPDFGAALAAAVATWGFTAEAAAASPEREFEYEFALARVAHGARRLAELIGGGAVIPNRAAGLDRKPKLVARPGLVYPRELLDSKVSGTARVEFIVDRSGLAQLPRVVAASDPAFGWAALTCVNGMRFEPITCQGKPTELRVLLPLSFSPPAEASAAEPGGPAS